MTRSLFIAIFVSLGVLAQPIAFALPSCCGKCAPAGLAATEADASASIDDNVRSAHSCCNDQISNDRDFAHTVMEPDSPEIPGDQERTCPCSTLCCHTLVKVPLYTSSSSASMFYTDVRDQLVDEPTDLYLDPHAIGLIRPPRAPAIG